MTDRLQPMAETTLSSVCGERILQRKQKKRKTRTAASGSTKLQTATSLPIAAHGGRTWITPLHGWMCGFHMAWAFALTRITYVVTIVCWWGSKKAEPGFTQRCFYLINFPRGNCENNYHEIFLKRKAMQKWRVQPSRHGQTGIRMLCYKRQSITRPVPCLQTLRVPLHTQ